MYNIKICCGVDNDECGVVTDKDLVINTDSSNESVKADTYSNDNPNKCKFSLTVSVKETDSGQLKDIHLFLLMGRFFNPPKHHVPHIFAAGHLFTTHHDTHPTCPR